MSRFFWGIITSAFLFSNDVPDTLGEVHNKKESLEKKIIDRVLLYFWLALIFIVIFSCIYFFSRSTVFTVSANVEQVSISPFVGQKYPNWKFDKAKLYPDCGEESIDVSGQLYPDSNAYIEFLRVQKGDLLINLDSEDSDSVGVFITEAGKSIKLEDCSSLKLSINNTDSHSHVFPIEGQIKLGGDIKEGSDNVPILYSGDVTIVDKALITRDYYSVGPFKLKMGDIFVVEGLLLKSAGFVQIDGNKGINVTYSSKGRKGFIKKYKTESIEIRNGFWTKIYNDPSLVLLWFIGIGVFKVSKTIIRIQLNNITD